MRGDGVVRKGIAGNGICPVVGIGVFNLFVWRMTDR